MWSHVRHDWLARPYSWIAITRRSQRGNGPLAKPRRRNLDVSQSFSRHWLAATWVLNAKWSICERSHTLLRARSANFWRGSLLPSGVQQPVLGLLARSFATG